MTNFSDFAFAQDAIQAWTRCLELDPTNGGYNAKLYSNRANAHSKLRNHEAAIKDCGRAIELDSGFVKAYLRRAASLYALGGVENLEACIRDYEHVEDMVDESGQRDIQQKVIDDTVHAAVATSEATHDSCAFSSADSTGKDRAQARSTKRLLRDPRRHPGRD